ncbi:MAG: sensor histidine kinase [Ignavibacteria bacterium]|nr:MAG: sensor histidine kinase [Ignavibacteria bacterium]KAF0157611.1 MAG: sensor histidine kinase [Ignavibacteria bacterium]
MIASAFIAFLLIFNVILYFVITFQLTAVLDAKISHEIEHIASAFRIKNNSIEIIRQSEFEESALVELNDNPFFLQIYSKNGKIILQSENIKMFAPVRLSFPTFNTFEYFENTETIREVVRTGYRKLFNEHGVFVGFLQLSARKLRIDTAIKNIFFYNVLLLPFLLVIIVVISVIISKKTFQPLNAIIETADKITATNLKEKLVLDSDPHDELSKLKLTLNNLFSRLENQIQQISSFSDNASHQLLTPLTVINSELELLLKSQAFDQHSNDSIKIIKEQSDRMTLIIKSLLILARDEHARTNCNSVFNLNSAVEEILKSSTKKTRVKSIIAESIYIKGNVEHFIIALSNIIENALKYSSDSPVTITASNNNNNCKIKVIDSGIGIAEADKSKIFDKFFRSNDVENLGVKGYGLGLSLAKSIINSIGGEISLEDNSPKGSIFIISLKSVRFD